MGTVPYEIKQNKGSDELQVWIERLERGRDLVRHIIPGLALLWQEYTDRNETGSLEYADLSLRLGLFLRAISDSPYDWWRVSGLHEGNCYKLVGQALLAIGPEPAFSERVQGINQAFAVIGQRAAGKGTFLGFLEELGVKCAPSSTALRQVVRAKLVTRAGSIPELINEGTVIKERFGGDVLIRWTFNRLWNLYGKSMSQIAIDGLRNDDELEAFMSIFGDKAFIVAIDTPEEKLWENIIKRQKENDRIDYATYEEFLKTQEIERNRITALMQKPRVIRIDNSGTLADLRVKAAELIHGI